MDRKHGLFCTVPFVVLADERAVLFHLERYLGTMSTAVRAVRAESQGGGELPFWLVTFPDQTYAPAQTHATLGLSSHVLEHKAGRLRQEILMCAPPGVRAREWLNYLGEILLARHRAFAPGETTPSFGPLSPGSTVSGFVFTAPTYWPTELGSFDQSDPPVDVIWAVPLTLDELGFVQSHGSRATEMLLAAEDPDVTDWHRRTMRGVH